MRNTEARLAKGCCLALALLVAGCGDDDATAADDGTTPDVADADAGPDADADADAGDGSEAEAGADADAGADGDTGPDGDADGDGDAACPAAALGARLGRDRFLLGGSMGDDSFDASPFDVRYRYLAGAVPADGPCASCAAGCTVNGSSCANSAGCEWWGCWQWDALPPGRYVADHVRNTREAGAIPMITYYVWLAVSGYDEGAGEIATLANAARLRSYLLDFAFLCDVLSEAPEAPVIVHLEPDLWGYGHQRNDDPAAIPAAVSGAGIAECSGLPDTFAGFGRCLVAIARARAPQALVAFHASAWGAGHDAMTTTDPAVDLDAHADETAAFLRAIGADASDLIVVEQSDRDAAFDGDWWDETNATRPNFHQAIGWVRRLSASLGLAHLWWQVPYGHRALENVCDRYQDNRVDYFFAHPDEYAAAGGLGIAFGAGASCQTTPETDGGHFLAHAAAWFAGPRPPLCGSP